MTLEEAYEKYEKKGIVTILKNGKTTHFNEKEVEFKNVLEALKSVFPNADIPAFRG